MRSFLSFANASSHSSQVSQTEASINVQALPRKMNRVEVEHMLTAYARDASRGENRLEAKKKMLACFDALNKSTGAAFLSSIQRGLHLKTAPVDLDLSALRLRALPENLRFLDGLHALNLSSNKLEVLPDSIGAVSTLEKIVLRDNCLQSLPESIGDLSNLQHLMLMSNKFRNLPEPVVNLSKLKSLDVRHNEVENVPQSINGLSELSSLLLSDNKLRDLPESVCHLSKLRTLLIDKNELQSLPASIGNLSNLHEFSIQKNLLSDLPQSFVSLPASCRVDLVDNPVSTTVREQLQNAIVANQASHPEQGPHVIFSMAAFNRAVTVKTLNEEIESWRAESGVEKKPSEPQRKVFEETLSRLSNVESTSLSNQLARMRVTAHYVKAPQDLVQRVNAFLNYIEQAPDLIKTIAAVAVEGTETCDDRIALAFIEMEEAVVHHQSMNEPSLDKLVETAGGLHKSQLLKEIAQQKVSTLVGFKDPTEVILKYVVNLSKEFKLPSQFDDMIFHACATQVTEEDIQNARSQILEQSTNTHLNIYLSTWEPWKQALSKQHPAEFAQIQSEVENRQEEMHQEMETLSEQMLATKARHGELSPQYLDLQASSNTLYAAYRNIEANLLVQLTQLARSN